MSDSASQNAAFKGLRAAIQENPDDMQPRLEMTDLLIDNVNKEAGEVQRAIIAMLGGEKGAVARYQAAYEALKNTEGFPETLKGSYINPEGELVVDASTLIEVSYTDKMVHTKAAHYLAKLAIPTVQITNLSGALSKIEGDSFPGYQVDQSFPTLLNSPALECAHRLNLRGSGLDATSLIELDNEKWSGKKYVRHLDLSHHELDVYNNDLTDLASIGNMDLPNLESLSLAECSLCHTTELDNKRYMRLTGLKTLDLSGNPLGELPNFSRLTHLESLYLSNVKWNFLGNEDETRAFLRNQNLKNLRKLNISNSSNLTAHVINALRDASADYPVINQLTHLNISHNNLNTEAVTTMVNSGMLSAKEQLDLSGNPIGDGGLTRLANTPTVAKLRELNIADTGFTDAGVQAVLASKYMANLKTLTLGDAEHPYKPSTPLRTALNKWRAAAEGREVEGLTPERAPSRRKKGGKGASLMEHLALPSPEMQADDFRRDKHPHPKSWARGE